MWRLTFCILAFLCSLVKGLVPPTRIPGAVMKSRTFSSNMVSQNAQDDAVENDDDELGEDSLVTLEELTLRFTEVLAHYRETKEMTPNEVCLAMLRTRLVDLKLNRCALGESTIPGAGLGVFASCDIAKGELITLFPGDALLAWNCGTVGDFSSGVSVMFGNHVQERDATRVTTATARGYELKIRPSHSIVADPLLQSDVAYLGHMMNDGAMLNRGSNAARTAYSRATFEAHNAAFFVVEDCHFAGVATRDITQEEELFVSYGEGYWLSRMENAAQSSSRPTQ